MLALRGLQVSPAEVVQPQEIGPIFAVRSGRVSLDGLYARYDSTGGDPRQVDELRSKLALLLSSHRFHRDES
jgi:hypothetical protein